MALLGLSLRTRKTGKRSDATIVARLAIVLVITGRILARKIKRKLQILEKIGKKDWLSSKAFQT